MIAVFGSTGKVGGKVAAELLESGVPVRVLVRSPEKAEPLKNEGAEIVQGDLLNLDDVKRAMDRCDGAFLMTPVNHRSDRFVEEEIEIGQNYATALKDSTINHIVHLSIWKAREGTGIPFFETKLVVEDALLPSGVDCTFLRPVNFMENIFMQAPFIQQYGMVSLPVPADVPIPMVASEDVAYAATQSLLRGGRGKLEAYDVLGPKDYTMAEVTEMISRIIDKPLRYQEMTPDQAREVFTNLGMSQRAIDAYITYFEAMPDMRVEGDRNRVYDEFNFEPTTLETVLEAIGGALRVEIRPTA